MPEKRDERHPPHRYAPLAGLMAIAFMWLLEIFYFSLDYTRGLLHGSELLEFYLCCFGVLLVAWPPLAWAALGLTGAIGWFDRHRRLALGCLLLEALVWVGYLGGMIGASDSGYRSWWWLFLPLAVLAVLAVWRFGRRTEHGLGAMAVASLASVACNLNLVWAFEEQFFRSGFSVEVGRPLLTTVAALVSFVITSFTVHGFTARPSARRSAWLPLAWIALAVGLYHVNATAFVDNYLWAHLRIAGMGVLCAWALCEWLTVRLPKRPVWETFCHALHYAAPITGLLCIVVVALVPRHAPAYYAAAVHTRFTRQALELMANAAAPFTRSSGHEAIDALSLTGHPVPLSMGWPRPPLDGAVLFMIDMKRQQDIALYRHARGEMPHTASCFEDGFRFLRAYASANVTKVTFPTLFSSAYGATRQDHWPNGFNCGPWQSHKRRAALGSVFRRAGFRTMALVGGYYHVHFFESGREEFKGFDTVLADGPKVASSEEGMSRVLRQSGGVVPATGKFLSVIMLQLHAQAHIGFIDRYIGSICDELRKKARYDRTALLLTSDHGVQYREHGRTTYGHTLFNEEILVPHVLRIPGWKGRDIETEIGSLDVLPSLIDLFGIQTDVLVEGKSYLPWLKGRHDKVPLLFSESRTDVRAIAVIDGPFKLIRWSPTGAEAMFDMGEDPGERVSIAASPAHLETYQRLRRDLDEFQKKRGDGQGLW